MSGQLFQDRKDAGRKLAEKLNSYAHRADVIVLGLPRGGVPVAFEVAAALNIRMNVFIVRKIGVPDHPEFAMGAIASGGTCYLNENVIRQLHVQKSALELVIAEEKQELKRREDLYRIGPAFDFKKGLNNRRVILVDDGIATGASMLAAIAAVRAMGPKELIVAVPVIAASSIPEIETEVSSLVYVSAPYHFNSVGEWYSDFAQTTDDEVRDLLLKGGYSDMG